MSLTIEFSPQEEASIVLAAQREGTDQATLIKRLVREHLPQPKMTSTDGPDKEAQALLNLLQSWREEDATDDVEELQRGDAILSCATTREQVSTSRAADLMSLVAVILDTTPLGLASQRKGKSSEADACLLWVSGLLAQGVRVYVPEIADYEVRRSLIRDGQTNSVTRLDAFGQLARYLPITTDVMRTAAALWAAARNAGLPRM